MGTRVNLGPTVTSSKIQTSIYRERKVLSRWSIPFWICLIATVNMNNGDIVTTASSAGISASLYYNTRRLSVCHFRFPLLSQSAASIRDNITSLSMQWFNVSARARKKNLATRLWSDVKKTTTGPLTARQHFRQCNVFFFLFFFDVVSFDVFIMEIIIWEHILSQYRNWTYIMEITAIKPSNDKMKLLHWACSVSRSHVGKSDV